MSEQFVSFGNNEVLVRTAIFPYVYIKKKIGNQNAALNACRFIGLRCSSIANLGGWNPWEEEVFKRNTDGITFYIG